MRFKVVMILLLLPLSTSFIGCSTVKSGVIHPIGREDIFKVPKGAVVHVPAGTIMKNDKGQTIARWDVDTDVVVVKDGRFLSNTYILEVMKVQTDDADAVSSSGASGK